jgi:methylenetetrahydrofolate dehydrogenase (NADP+) / methenyltetrahydrofolate cyclohydrolase
LVRKPFVSCTPAGIQEILKRYNIETKGKHVVVVGRSNIVGKPVANLLLQKKEHANAVVTVCHSAAKDLAYLPGRQIFLLLQSEVRNLLKADMVKEGVVVIDVGINRKDDPSHPKGSRLVGDVAFNEVAPKSSYITPVPGGIGLMTVAMLLKNTFKAYKLYDN